MPSKWEGVLVASPLTIHIQDIEVDSCLLNADALRLSATGVSLNALYEDLLSSLIFPNPRPGSPQESPHFENGLISRLFGPLKGRTEGPKVPH